MKTEDNIKNESLSKNLDLEKIHLLENANFSLPNKEIKMINKKNLNLKIIKEKYSLNKEIYSSLDENIIKNNYFNDLEKIKSKNYLNFPIKTENNKDFSIKNEKLKSQVSDINKIVDLENKSKSIKKIMKNKKNSIVYQIKNFLDKKLLDNNYYICFMMSLTIFILFIGDIQSGWLGEEVKFPIDIIQTVIFGLYTLEVIITSICKESYFGSFFFWLDIVSTLIITVDINYIFYQITGITGNNSNLFFNNNDYSNYNPISSNSTITNGDGGNLSSVYTALSKLTAASRIVKLYKAAQLAKINLDFNKKKTKTVRKNSRRDFSICYDIEGDVHSSNLKNIIISNDITNSRRDIMKRNSLQISEFDPNIVHEIENKKNKKDFELQKENNLNENEINNDKKENEKSNNHSKKNKDLFMKKKEENHYSENTLLTTTNNLKHNRNTEEDNKIDTEESHPIKTIDSKSYLNTYKVKENTIFPSEINSELTIYDNKRFSFFNQKNKDIISLFKYRIPLSIPSNSSERSSKFLKYHKNSENNSNRNKNNEIIDEIYENTENPEDKFQEIKNKSETKKNLKTSYTKNLNYMDTINYKFYQDQRIRKEKLIRDDVQIDNLLSESKTRIFLSESITKKVIILILLLIIISPFLEPDLYLSNDTKNYNILAKYISNFEKIQLENYNTSILGLINEESDPIYPIIRVNSTFGILFQNTTYQNITIRPDDIEQVISEDGEVIIFYTMLYDNQLVGLLNIIKTIFVCVCLTISTQLFEYDTQMLILDPLEIMIEIVDIVSKDPTCAKNLENLESGAKSTLSKINFFDKNQLKKYEKQKETTEIKVIQSVIMKISALLTIGFGEAGNEIITENLSNYSDLDPMIKGRKKNAIFGFCDIRSFPLVNEALQEETVVFLNRIADIVHSSVDLFYGSTNKNIGDAFLTVWKLEKKENIEKVKLDKINNENIDIKDEKKKSREENISRFIKKSSERIKKLKTIQFQKYDEISETKEEEYIQDPIRNTADHSVLAFLDIIIKINRDLKILEYSLSPEIAKQIKNFRVNMGFGLHMGWAIEGAIGSNYKIDASYLSPNVNISARLEGATRQYGVSLLISGELFDLLSEDVKKICRLIDIVTLKGSIEPIKLYTIDVNENLKPSKNIRGDFSCKITRKNQSLKKIEMEKYSENFSLTKLILRKKQFKKLLKNARPERFLSEYNLAFKYYISGQWDKSKLFLDICLKLYENDGPVKMMYEYMESFNFISPFNWNGYRALTSK